MNATEIFVDRVERCDNRLFVGNITLVQACFSTQSTDQPLGFLHRLRVEINDGKASAFLCEFYSHRASEALTCASDRDGMSVNIHGKLLRRVNAQRV